MIEMKLYTNQELPVLFHHIFIDHYVTFILKLNSNIVKQLYASDSESPVNFAPPSPRTDAIFPWSLSFPQSSIPVSLLYQAGEKACWR